MSSNKVHAAYRSDKGKRPYRKLNDRIKPTSKGAFLQIGSVTEAKYDSDGNVTECIEWDMSTAKKRKRHAKKRKPKAKRTILRKAKRITCYR